MKLKVLGSGSSGNCYLLQNKNETLILECGLPWKIILKGLNFNLNNVAGCLVTHEHKDHSKVITDVISNGIDVYSSKGTLKSMYFGIGYYRLKVIMSEQQFKVGDFTVLPFATEHDAAEPLGFLIQHSDFGKLLFITDSYYCQYKFNDLDHIMIECNYSRDILNENIEKGYIHPALANRLLKSHFSLASVREFLKATDISCCKDITLIHLSDGNSNATEFKKDIERLTGIPVYIADKGLEIDLSR